MATINNNYAIPSSIRWTTGDVGSASQSMSTFGLAEVWEGGRSFKLAWICRHYTYQVQWRVRRRNAPTYDAILGTISGEEVWEEWPDTWQGNDLSSDVKSDTERLSWGDQSVTAFAFDIPYDFSKYDKAEYQFRVRAFDESSKNCSDWGYSTLTVCYRPAAKVESAVRQPNGDVLLSIDTNWVRGGNRFRLTNMRLDGSMRSIETGINISGVDPDLQATIPAKLVGNANSVYASMDFITSDNCYAVWDSKTFAIGKDEPSEPVPAPYVSVSDAESHAVVTVQSTGDAYSSVLVAASYTDALGNASTIEAEAVEDGGVWTAYVEAPPYDVPVTYRASVVTDSGWDYAETVHVTPSKGRCTWSDGEDAVSLVFDLEVESSFSSDTEVVDLADGRSVARFGNGGQRKLSISGNLLNPSIAEGAWRPALERLRRSKKVWVYRKPGGERCNVVVTGTSDSEKSGTIDKVVKVSVSMREVS